jgi:hypothetical protein
LDELRISNIVRYTSSYIPVNRFADDVKWYFCITLMKARGCCLGTLRFWQVLRQTGKSSLAARPKALWFLRDGPRTHAPKRLTRPHSSRHLSIRIPAMTRPSLFPACLQGEEILPALLTSRGQGRASIPLDNAKYFVPLPPP